jgi:transposase
MDRDSLERLLAQGLSLEQIGKRFGRHPSTVSYWIGKHGLEAANRERHAARGGLEREVLEAHVRAGKSIAKISADLGVSDATVKHWLAKFDLKTLPTIQRRLTREAREAGVPAIERTCRHHGLTEFRLYAGRYYKCVTCSWQAVTRRRRRVRETLVQEAGGRCAICGYDRSIAALEFHHLDRETKSFGVSDRGMTRSLARLREEVDKCILLCSNCHAEVENGVVSLPA